MFEGKQPALSATGNQPSLNSPPANPCELTGTFVVPGKVPVRSQTTAQLSSLIRNAPEVESTSGTYTLQAAPNRTVIVTAIHTVVIKRIRAPRETIVGLNSGCAGAAPPTYDVSVNLDAHNLTPKVQLEDANRVGKATPEHGLQAIVTNGSPILIDYSAETHEYAVTWKFRIDYTINGEQKTAWIPAGSQPFRTVAALRSDPAVAFTLTDGENTWTAHSVEPPSWR